MVTGLKRFSEHFAGYEDHYFLIGGTALWLVMDEAGLETRATKDIDIVLCVEALDAKFVAVFWQFIRDGQYQVQQRSTGGKIFYRFQKPQVEGFPVMLELFSRRPDGVTLDDDTCLTPIPVDEEVSSLSAILLDDDYYRMLHLGKRMVDGISIVDEFCLMLLKARAWLDLVDRRKKGEKIDGKSIKKHRNDVLRLYQLLEPTKRIEVPETIAADIEEFLTRVAPEIDGQLLNSLGFKGVEPQGVLQAIGSAYIARAEANEYLGAEHLGSE
ncbi:MAG TPA: hypothetical protein VF267_08420 [Gammaproteobacteria bacterium]